jgi:hypothetical protein
MLASDTRVDNQQHQVVLLLVMIGHQNIEELLIHVEHLYHIDLDLITQRRMAHITRLLTILHTMITHNEDTSEKSI